MFDVVDFEKMMILNSEYLTLFIESSEYFTPFIESYSILYIYDYLFSPRCYFSKGYTLC